jgi:hypothetical protein
VAGQQNAPHRGAADVRTRGSGRRLHDAMRGWAVGMHMEFAFSVTVCMNGEARCLDLFVFPIHLFYAIMHVHSKVAYVYAHLLYSQQSE